MLLDIVCFSLNSPTCSEYRQQISQIPLLYKQETKRRPLTIKLTAKAILAAAATDSAGCHRDSIVSLASVKLNQRLLLSSGRDGAIKVWK